MNPEGSRQLEAFNGRPRILDNRYPSNFTGMPQTSMPNIDNYIMQISQMMFPPYPYFGYPCPSNGFMSSMGAYRDPALFNMNIPPQMNSYRTFYNPQNMRVNSRETREKYQAKVINLQSDEEEPKQKNVPVPPPNNTIKQTQKPALVINLEDNSDEKIQKKEDPPVPPAPPKIQIPIKLPKPQVVEEKKKQPKIEMRKKDKEMLHEIKTKLIAKMKQRQPKIIKPQLKQLRQEKPQKQKKKKALDAEKVNLNLKPEKQKQLEKIEKKKIDKPQKPQKPEKNQKNEKNEKNDKNKKVMAAAVEQKIKPEELHTKEIAKYMESHGQIRHGKEFQSDIPAVKICNGIWFNRWLEEKRKNILRRQVGALTY